MGAVLRSVRGRRAPQCGGEALNSVQEVLDGLRRERERLLDAVDALGPRGSEVAVTEEGGWTSKDVLAHLIHYAGQIARALGAQIEPPSYVVQETRRLSGQEWNERAVEFWSGSSLEEVRSELERVADLVEQRVETLSDEDLAVRDRVPWAPDRPLWEFIGHDTFLHEWPAHAKQIESAARS